MINVHAPYSAKNSEEYEKFTQRLKGDAGRTEGGRKTVLRSWGSKCRIGTFMHGRQ